MCVCVWYTYMYVQYKKNLICKYKTNENVFDYLSVCLSV